MNSIILLGSGGHCKSCIDVIEKSYSHKIKGIIDKYQLFKEKYKVYFIIEGTQEFKIKDYIKSRFDFFFY